MGFKSSCMSYLKRCIYGKLRKRKRVAVRIETALTNESGLSSDAKEIDHSKETLGGMQSGAHMDTRDKGLGGRVGHSRRLP
ncbi:uncharacterized protein FTOL_07805 [Fusarium torulosum]|uniref:Uncharacterized protein n=1 Tax=Fusarium torulosum TaxID=33205 RepID=A0AAE8MBM6_9HYPO|nr:uncharacterized protein FTOL_07805 [Fusarium torulosum]